MLGHVTHDVAAVANRQGADVTIVYRRPIDKMPATKMEIEHVTQEGVQIRDSLVPLEVIKGEGNRAVALRVQEAEWEGNTMTLKEGTEFDIECDLIVAAIGQVGDLTGMEELDNGRGLIDADPFYRAKGQADIFIGGDIVKPHLLTTAIGHASVAAEGIDHILSGKEPARGRRSTSTITTCWKNCRRSIWSLPNTRMSRSAAPIPPVTPSTTTRTARVWKSCRPTSCSWATGLTKRGTGGARSISARRTCSAISRSVSTG